MGYKLALGIPFSASRVETYKEAGILPLDAYLNFVSSKSLLGNSCVPNSNRGMNLDWYSINIFPEQGEVHLTFNNSWHIYISLIGWNGFIFKEHCACSVYDYCFKLGNFDIDYAIKERENFYLLAFAVRFHINENHLIHLETYRPDGSILQSKQPRAAAAIPVLEVEEKYYVEKDFSAFTALLLAILTALSFPSRLPVTIFHVFFVSIQNLVRSTNLNIKASG